MTGRLRNPAEHARVMFAGEALSAERGTEHSPPGALARDVPRSGATAQPVTVRRIGVYARVNGRRYVRQRLQSLSAEKMPYPCNQHETDESERNQGD